MAGTVNGARAYRVQQHADMAGEVETYAPLVKRIALHFKARLPPNVELDDLIQSGMLGLMDAVANFQDGRGATFETYAAIRIRGAMIDQLRQSDWTPRSVHQGTRQIADAISRLSQRLGREPKDSEIAAELKVSTEQYRQMLTESASSQIIGIEDLGVTEDVISDSQDSRQDRLFETLATSRFKQALAGAIERLPEREQYVLALYYDEELNLKEIGRVLELSESRISQILSQAMARLRSYLREWRRD